MLAAVRVASPHKMLRPHVAQHPHRFHRPMRPVPNRMADLVSNIQTQRRFDHVVDRIERPSHVVKHPVGNVLGSVESSGVRSRCSRWWNILDGGCLLTNRRIPVGGGRRFAGNVIDDACITHEEPHGVAQGVVTSGESTHA